VLLAALLLVPVVAVLRRRRGDGGAARVVDAGLVAAYVAFLLGLGVDWIWQLPAVAVAGIAVAALLAVPGARRTRARGRRAWPATAVAVSLVLAVLAVETIPFLAAERLQASARAAGRGDLLRAVAAAQDSRSIEPWDAAPYVQLALLSEQLGRYRAADRWIHEAVARSRADWTLWLVATRVETRLGQLRRARASLAEARRLDPLGVQALVG